CAGARIDCREPVACRAAGEAAPQSRREARPDRRSARALGTRTLAEVEERQIVGSSDGDEAAHVGERLPTLSGPAELAGVVRPSEAAALHEEVDARPAGAATGQGQGSRAREPGAGRRSAAHAARAREALMTARCCVGLARLRRALAC